MKESLIFLPITVLYLALKSTLMPGFHLPDLPLIIVFYLAYRKTGMEGALYGFVLGYVDDAFSGAIIGSSSFSLVVVFLIVHIASRRVRFTTPDMKAGGAAALALTKEMLTYSVLRSAGFGIGVLPGIFLDALITGIFAPAIIPALHRISSLINPDAFKEKPD
jgi:rod shape-determining protein MreD